MPVFALFGQRDRAVASKCKIIAQHNDKFRLSNCIMSNRPAVHRPTCCARCEIRPPCRSLLLVRR